MASAQFAMGLWVCVVLLIGILGVRADPTTEFDCPSEFKSGRDNDVTYNVNSVGITNAQCFLDSAVIFTYASDCDTEGRTVCLHTYPPTSCNDFNTSDTCGCTKQEGTIYTYKYTFPSNKGSLCGKIQASLCQEPSGPFEENVSPNCNTIRFADPTDSIVLIVTGQVMFVAASVLLIYFHVYKTDFPWNGSCKNNAVTLCFVIVVVGMLIFDALATYFACGEFPKESTCTTVCHACIPLTTANCAVIFVILMIERKEFVGLVIGYVIAYIAVIICCCCSKEPPPQPPVTITSKPDGQSKDSYKLEWTVPATDNADIETFSILYKQVKVDQSGKPVMPITTIGENNDPPKTVGGQCRSAMLKPLSAGTFYELTITVIKKNGSSQKGSPFVFKTGGGEKE